MIFTSILVFLGTAHAVPTQMGHQGRVLDADGLPAEGPHTLDFHLYDAAEDGTMIWSEVHDVELINGYYSLVLGADELDNPLEDELLRDNELHLELTVGDDEPLSPRQALNAVPYARLAATATSVNGGSVNASEVSIGGALVIDSSGAWVGTTPTMSWSDLSDVPEDVDTVLSGDEVDAFCSDNGYAMAADLATVATSGSWSDLSGVPEDLDTILSEDEVDAFCSDNGYAMDADVYETAMGLTRMIESAMETVAADMATMEAETDASLETMGSEMSEALGDLAIVTSTGSYEDLTDKPAAIGVNAVHFTESGTFTVPDGVTTLFMYLNGGGGGGSNGGSTSIDLGTHSHNVNEHSHSGGSHTHAIGDHTHSGGASHTHSIGSSCSRWSTPCYSAPTCLAYSTDYSGDAVGGGGAGSGSTGEVDEGETGTASSTTDAPALSTSVVNRGGNGGSGGGLNLLLAVTPASTCEIVIGTGGTVDDAGTSTIVTCGDAIIECEGGLNGNANGTDGSDGSCSLSEGTQLATFKATRQSPGGSGAGGPGSGATSGQSGAVTLRY